MPRKKKNKKDIQSYHWGEEPQWDGLSPTEAEKKYAFALNWYNYMASDNQKKKWVIEYAKSKKMKKEVVKQLEGVDAKRFDIGYGELSGDDLGLDTGVYARLLTLNAPVPKEKELKLKKCLVHLITKKSKTSSDERKIPNIQENIRNKSSEILSEIYEHEEKLFSSQFKEGREETLRIVRREETKAAHCRFIRDELSSTLIEIENIPHDKQLKEAYSNYKKTFLKKYVLWLKDMMNECDLKMANVSRVRKPRKKKVKSADEVAKKAQIQESFSELGLKSMPASAIVGSSSVVLYNTNTREIQVLSSFNGQELTIRGTTIMNFDPSNSFKKRVRKPEVIKTTFSKKVNKTTFKKFFEELLTKPSTPNGRLNKYTMILCVF